MKEGSDVVMDHRLTEDEKRRLWRALTRADKRSWKRLTPYLADTVLKDVDRVLKTRGQA